MRIGELVSGLRCMITNEQRAIFELLKETDRISRSELDERSLRLAEEMTSQGLIDRLVNEENNEVFYCLFKR